MTNSILVAGGGGFLGANLVKRLLADNWQVTVLDNFCTGKRDNLDKLQAEYLDSLTVIECDITDKLPGFEQGFQVVVNMACQASPVAYQQHPIETLRVSSLGTENLLSLVVKDKSRYVHASTSEVYGDPLSHPQSEDYWGNVNPYGPRSMYDEGKRYGEAIIWTYRKLYNLNTGIVRIFNTFGPFMDKNDGRVVTNFIYQALADQPLTVYGSGKQTRSFCYVDDQIDAWMKMINSEVEGPINIGNPQEFTVLELAEKIGKVLGKPVQIKYEPESVDDPLQRCPDITLAKKLLEWQPKIELEEGLTRMIDWIKADKLEVESVTDP